MPRKRDLRRCLIFLNEGFEGREGSDTACIGADNLELAELQCQSNDSGVDITLYPVRRGLGEAEMREDMEGSYVVSCAWAGATAE